MNNKIQIIIPYSNHFIHDKDFEVFCKGIRLLKYSTDLIVVGDFPDEIPNKLTFIEKWFKCKEDDIPKVLSMVHKKLSDEVQ
jgi:hypothetical protein